VEPVDFQRASFLDAVLLTTAANNCVHDLRSSQGSGKPACRSTGVPAKGPFAANLVGSGSLGLRIREKPAEYVSEAPKRLRPSRTDAGWPGQPICRPAPPPEL
jgi:hypothetical protein